MSDPRDDRELSKLFTGLRREVAATVPSFERTLAAIGSRRHLEQLRHPWHIVATGCLAPGIALWFMWSPMPRQAEPPGTSSPPVSATLVSDYLLPTDVLLLSPDADVWGTLPALGCLDPGLTCGATERPGGPAQESRDLTRREA